jgi:hypothetical protein
MPLHHSCHHALHHRRLVLSFVARLQVGATLLAQRCERHVVELDAVCCRCARRSGQTARREEQLPIALTYRQRGRAGQARRSAAAPAPEQRLCPLRSRVLLAKARRDVPSSPDGADVDAPEAPGLLTRHADASERGEGRQPIHVGRQAVVDIVTPHAGSRDNKGDPQPALIQAGLAASERTCDAWNCPGVSPSIFLDKNRRDIGKSPHKTGFASLTVCGKRHPLAGLLTSTGGSVIRAENDVGRAADAQRIDRVDHGLDPLRVRPVLAAVVTLELARFARGATAAGIGRGPRGTARRLAGGGERVAAVVLLRAGVDGGMAGVQMEVDIEGSPISRGVADEGDREVSGDAVDVGTPPLRVGEQLPRCGPDVHVLGAARDAASIEWTRVGGSEIVPVPVPTQQQPAASSQQPAASPCDSKMSLFSWGRGGELQRKRVCAGSRQKAPVESPAPWHGHNFV